MQIGWMAPRGIFLIGPVTNPNRTFRLLPTYVHTFDFPLATTGSGRLSGRGEEYLSEGVKWKFPACGNRSQSEMLVQFEFNFIHCICHIAQSQVNRLSHDNVAIDSYRYWVLGSTYSDLGRIVWGRTLSLSHASPPTDNNGRCRIR